MPGYSTRTFGAGRVILHAVEDVQNLYLPGGITIDASLSSYQGTKVLPAGLPMKRETSGLYTPWKGALAVGAGVTSDQLIVDDAGLFAVGDAIHVGSTTTTVEAVDYETNTITLVATASWSDNGPVGPASGYDAANLIVGFLSDEFGVDLQPNGSDEDVPGRLLIRGRVKLGMIINGPAVVASIVAAEQRLMNDIQIWDGDERVA